MRANPADTRFRIGGTLAVLALVAALIVAVAGGWSTPVAVVLGSLVLVGLGLAAAD